MICRDVEFWDDVAQHPEVAPHVFMGRGMQTLAPLINDPAVMPLASENGGMLLISLDVFGLVREMHTMYRPEGWGREVAQNVRLFMREAFQTVEVIFTHEQEDYWRSKPPRSHGWKPLGDYCYVGLTKRIKLWQLTRADFFASPIGRKMCQ